MQFADVTGQEEVKRKLRKLVRESRMPHALLLFGPPGSGKLPLAVALTRYLSCIHREEGDACGVCPSCVKFGKLAHPDLHFAIPVLPTSKVAKAPVTDDFAEEWREAFLSNPYLSENQWYEAIGAENKQGIINRDESMKIARKLSFKPYESDYRMLVIWLPEKMNRTAANKLLKLVEEPPDRTVMVMVSENTDQILPTILSRTQMIHVPPLTREEIREGLQRRGEFGAGMVEDAVSKANGDFQRALRTLREDEGELRNFELFTGLMRLCYGRKIIEISDWVDRVAGIGRERQKQLIDYSLNLLRENFILQMGRRELTYLSKREAEFSQKFSPFIHSGNIQGLTKAFTMAGNHIEANGNPRIILLDLSIQVIRLLMKKEPVTG